MADQTEPTTPADQLKHMARIAAILEKLDPADRRRAVAWFSDAYAADSDAGRYPVQTQEPS